MSLSQPRGTSNSNDRGSASSRRARKYWLLSPDSGWGGNGTVVPCYRADTHCNNYSLTFETMQVDRVIPGVLGGRYVKDNVRPACVPCNRATGHVLRSKIRRGEIVPVNRQPLEESA